MNVNTSPRDLYQRMSLIRAFEERVESMVSSGEARGLIHTSIGNEAVAVGVCAAMAGDDYLLTGHRGHGHLLARGTDPYRLLCEILGRRDGICAGMGGSMHVVDMSHHIIGATGVVGGNLAMALGAAYATHVRGADAVTVVFFGDGATSSGAFHEALNLAALWELPILFVCENNDVAEFTTRQEHSVVNDITAFAGPFGIPAERRTGTDVVEVRRTTFEYVAQMRRARGPALLEFGTRRLVGHYAGDPRRSEVARGDSTWDPLQASLPVLTAAGMTEADRDRADDEATRQVESIAGRALRAEPADPDLDALVYA